MTRRRTRILWGLTGAFLVLGLVVSAVAWLKPTAVSSRLLQLGAVFDVIAVILWMLVFAVSMTWARGPDRGDDGPRDDKT